MSTYDEIYQRALQLSVAERQRLIEQLTATTPSLTADAILASLTQHLDHLEGLGVARIGLFGSYVRGEARLDSDLDLLVEMADAQYSYMDLFGVQEYLESLFDVQIDLVPEDAIKSRLRPYIMGEVVYAESSEAVSSHASI